MHYTLDQALIISTVSDSPLDKTIVHILQFECVSILTAEDQFGCSRGGTPPASFPSPHNCLALPRQRHAKSPALAFFSIPTTLSTSTTQSHLSLLCTTRHTLGYWFICPNKGALSLIARPHRPVVIPDPTPHSRQSAAHHITTSRCLEPAPYLSFTCCWSIRQSP